MNLSSSGIPRVDSSEIARQSLNSPQVNVTEFLEGECSLRRIQSEPEINASERLQFIDLYSGCGGFSLGLSKAGWQGVFAVEKSPDAFATFRKNFCSQQSKYRFNWPLWLPCEEMTTQDLLNTYKQELVDLKGQISLIAGGPPCQGFSLAGRRDASDPRNHLIDEYIEIIDLIQPKIILLENVRGFQSPFPEDNVPYSEKLSNKIKKLSEHGYRVYDELLNAVEFGVPQTRIRFILIAFREDIVDSEFKPFEQLEMNIAEFRESRGINGKDISVKDAISDLEIRNVTPDAHGESSRFRKIRYTGRRKLTSYQKLMREGLDRKKEPDSLRLANHTDRVKNRFKKILKDCPHGVPLSKEKRKDFGLKKQCFTPLHKNRPARTITTLPDDMIHYCEPRILTVRENARLQSFPDWFTFQGKYTTGGHRRKLDVPRYSQVGNAVPPLLAEAIGEMLRKQAVIWTQ